MDEKRITRTNIINKIIEKNNYKSYLEIGVQSGINLDGVICPNKTGVDPDDGMEKWHGGRRRSRSANELTHKQTSDVFFENNNRIYKKTYDIIFIDGAHVFSYVYRDILNSLKFLNKGGTIVLHDMLPLTKENQELVIKQGTWNGDCWKAFVKARVNFGDQYEFFVIDEDEGCAIIRESKNPSPLNFVHDRELNWDSFCKNKQLWMNVVSYEEFIERL